MPRKYVFKDRAEAEVNYERERSNAFRGELAIQSMLLNEITWQRGQWYDVGRGGKDRADEGFHLTLFHPNAHQRPMVSVFSRLQAAETYQRLRHSESDDHRELCNLLAKAIN